METLQTIQNFISQNERIITICVCAFMLIVQIALMVDRHYLKKEIKKEKKELEWHEKVANGWRKKFAEWKYQEELRLNEPARKEATEKAFEILKLGKELPPKEITRYLQEFYSCLTGK